MEKTILFTGIITAMILSFSAMDYSFDNIPQAFAMQHVVDNHNVSILTERTTNEVTQIVRHNKAMSFIPIYYFGYSYTDDLLDVSENNRNNISTVLNHGR